MKPKTVSRAWTTTCTYLPNQNRNSALLTPSPAESCSHAPMRPSLKPPCICMESDRQEFPAFLSIFCHTPPVETGPNSLTTLAAFSDSVPDVWGHRSTQGHKGEGGGRIEGELGGGG